MTALLSRYMEYKLPEVLRKRYPELVFDNGTLCPQVGDLPPGEPYITVETVQQYGEAAIASGQAQDVPMSEVTVGRESYDVVYIFGGAYYTDPELKAANFASRNGQIVTNFGEERLMAMRKMIDVKSNVLCAFGDSRYNIQGFLNNPDVHVTNTGTYKPYAANATAKAIIDMITEELYQMWETTTFVEQANVILLPTKLWKILNTTFRSELTESTLLSSLRAVNNNIVLIQPVGFLNSSILEENGVHASGTNKDRIMIYNLSPENVRRHYNPMEVMPPERDKMRWNICAYKGVSSVKFRYPKTARYLDFPIATSNN